MIWDEMMFFNREENWGDPDRMCPDFLRKLDRWRFWINYPVGVLAGYATKGHSSNSMHYRGAAMDGFIVNPTTGKRISAADTLYYLLASPFGGVGLYLWSENGPFFHVDSRHVEHERKMWVCFEEGAYEPLNLQNIQKILGLEIGHS